VDMDVDAEWYCVPVETQENGGREDRDDKHTNGK